ncbi:hypothetical protein [Anaerotruncus colihominis]|uniref:hypothetical protein n=1 Tax=Anaerotruncus colihominis TaxID=169435 RepID=UPI00321A60C5
MRKDRVGPRLTLKTARALALKVVGTAKGLEKDKTLAVDLYEMRLGELFVKIRRDWYGSGCISVSVDSNSGRALYMLFNPETLEQDFEAEERQREQDRREALKEWVESRGPDACKADIDRIWNQQ